MVYKNLEKHRAYCREYMKKKRLREKLKGGNDKKMFKKKAKGKSVAPPVDDIEEEEVEEEEEELEEIESETEAIKKEIEKVKAKRKPPVEESVEEELTEEKVKQILINFEQRLQKIEYNLRLIP